MEIVELNLENVSLLRNVADEVFDNPIESEWVAAFAECPRHCMVLAVFEITVVGMASAVEYFHPDKRPQLWINEVGVAPGYRNQGIGRQLMNSLLEIGERRGCSCAWIGTEPENAAARKCYESTRKPLPAEDFVLYEWPLIDA